MLQMSNLNSYVVHFLLRLIQQVVIIGTVFHVQLRTFGLDQYNRYFSL